MCNVCVYERSYHITCQSREDAVELLRVTQHAILRDTSLAGDVCVCALTWCWGMVFDRGPLTCLVVRRYVMMTVGVDSTHI